VSKTEFTAGLILAVSEYRNQIQGAPSAGVTLVRLSIVPAAVASVVSVPGTTVSVYTVALCTR
jgi:hypothetical protein